ncbi:STAS/SEC14 domain-containing protein [Arthrobacter sp. H16F315]|uniref:STAS/SEC14 domain-containing protein n=1 Tax=Arthrobacter sp. H16F315 TaxID=2955314 RepID=UPI002096E537|nr:STAS/SEC14 domain-containing protein [Arthrobacter sp. H16F315]MDD1478540.1 STAS/SEC14 domain-containing protein [Arthrobacter sp. H16F315]
MSEIALTCTNASLSVDTEGTFHLRWTPGSAVSAADAEAAVTAVQGVTGAAGLQPMLVEVVDVCMSPGARETLLGLRFVSAVALVGATVVDRVMAAALLREQECPHGYFTSMDDAREWLSRLPVPHALEESAV